MMLTDPAYSRQRQALSLGENSDTDTCPMRSGRPTQKPFRYKAWLEFMYRDEDRQDSQQWQEERRYSDDSREGL